MLTQSFATTPGQLYAVHFDYGVYSPVSQREQRLQVTIQGNAVLVSQLIAQSAFSSEVQYLTRNYSFVADSPTTSLTFRDVSLTSDSVDSYLDHVRLISPLQLTEAASRKTHGGSENFDIDMPLTGAPAVECRNGGGNYTLIFTFNNNVVSGGASVSSGVGSVSGSPTFAGTAMTVNLTGIADVQKITVALGNVADSNGQVLSNAAVSLNILISDTTGDKSVNSADISQTKSQSGLVLTEANSRMDVNIDGSINSADISLVKSRSGVGLP